MVTEMVVANVSREQALAEFQKIKDTKTGSPNTRYKYGWTAPLGGHGDDTQRFPCAEVGAC